MTFSSFKSFGTIKNQRILKQFHYSCETYDSSGLFNNLTKEYDGIFSNPAIISTVSPAVGTRCLTMNRNYFITLPKYTNSPNGFSVSFWVKTNSTAAYSRIIEYSNFRIFILETNLAFQAGGASTVYTAYPNFNDNVWRHFSFVFNPNATVIIYCNGIFYKSFTAVSYPYLNNGGYIGKSVSNNDPLFSGSIDDIRLYDDKIISADEAMQIYTNTFL